MKPLFQLALVSVLALSGCSRTARDSARDGSASAPPPPRENQVVPSTPVAFTPETGKLVTTQQVPLLEQINRENARVVAAAMPSIVRIVAAHPSDPRVRLFGSDIPFQLPFGSGQRRNAPTTDTAYGSGVVISKDGYILTNQHVIEEASLLEIQLQDKRTFTARIVAADDLVDVAILKIDASDLPSLPWGNSDDVQVGEQVFAIGNPFDLGASVSKGIVSATGRNLPMSPTETARYEDYIQTDAAINPGNSGGALLNIHGELIGLNAAIASTTRVNMGIGFAIPSNLVRYAVQGLLKEGRLVRGYLGVILPDSVDDGVIGQLNLKSSQGAFLAGIQPNSPAQKANLKALDFITGVDAHRIDSEADLRLVVAQIPIGKEVKVDFVRDGKPQTTTVRIEEFKPEDPAEINSESPTGTSDAGAVAVKDGPSDSNVLDGIQVIDMNDKARQKYGIGSLVASGVIVNNVQEGSLAEAKGIQRGDVLESVAINKGASEPIASTKDFTAVSGSLKPDQGVVMLVHDRDKGNSLVYLAPPAK
jgi:serine protease Do